MIGRGAGREQGDGTSRWLQATGKVPGGTEAGARVEEHESGNASCGSGRPSKMESPEKMPKEEWMEVEGN